MKKIHFWFLVLFSSFIYSQTNGISYQAVILDPNGNAPLVNQTICLQFKIINSSSLIDYQETITTSTDDFGMINTIIGSGIPAGGSAATFNDIVWNETSKSLMVEVDLNATCSSFIEISNQPFTSVPYALYATNGGSTNLSYTASPTDGIVVSNTGEDAIISLASETTAGLISPSEFSQLSNLANSFAQKQDVLVDTVNIKTINGNSILGNGDLVVDGKVSQTITNEVTTTAPSEDAVFDALDLKINKNAIQIAEKTPLNLFKITPFTDGNETFGIDFNSYANSGAGTGTYNHGTWIGYNTGHHSTTPTVSGKPSIMIGLEDNYFDHIGDLKFGTEFYVQGFSPNGTSVQISRPYYARGYQNDDGTDGWAVISNIGSSGSDRSFTVREGTNNLFQITPTSADFYAAETRINNILKVQTGNILMDNNSFFQIKNSAAGVASVMNVATDNTFYIGDIFNNLGGNVILRSGGISTLTLCNSGNSIFSGTTTATSFIKSGGTSDQFLKADGSVDTNIYQPLLTNPITGGLTTGYLSKATGTTTIGNSALTENGSSVSLIYPATGTIDTRLSISNSGNGGAGRGTAIVMGVPGSSNNVDGVKINAYTTGGPTVYQSVDLAFDLASSGTLEERMRLKSNGNVLIGTAADDNVNKLQVSGPVVATQYKLSALNTAPASATAPGTVGEIRYDADYMYVCVATNTWKRSPLTTW